MTEPIVTGGRLIDAQVLGPANWTWSEPDEHGLRHPIALTSPTEEERRAQEVRDLEREREGILHRLGSEPPQRPGSAEPWPHEIERWKLAMQTELENCERELRLRGAEVEAPKRVRQMDRLSKSRTRWR